jgi:2-polyprenyl-6-methoxyphenol hydroxylase-like FAD-dependent oxidoreductase
MAGSREVGRSMSGGWDAASVGACVVGAGPAGAALALILVRAGVEVVLLEKHGDFLRDFRGDTVHPSTLQVLDELGLAERFHRLPVRRIETLKLIQSGVAAEVADFRTLRGRYRYMAQVPQWDFLTLLTTEAARYPGFTLHMNAEATGLVRENGAVVGVRVQTADGEREVRAGLVVAADGRNSRLRADAGLALHDLDIPMDVMMFRLSRREEDPDEGLSVRIGNGRIVGVINRMTYWQMSFETVKGGYAKVRREGVEQLRSDVAHLVPFLADRVEEIGGIDDLHSLEVRVDRLRRWHRPGLLFIGDAAHAMSPAGGSGVNLAVQDAVAAANILTGPLLEHQRSGRPVPRRALAAVQRRRWLPTVVTQEFQRFLHRVLIARALRGEAIFGRTNPSAVFARIPFLQRLMSTISGVGLVPEHVRVPLVAKPRGDDLSRRIYSTFEESL